MNLAVISSRSDGAKAAVPVDEVAHVVALPGVEEADPKVMGVLLLGIGVDYLWSIQLVGFPGNWLLGLAKRQLLSLVWGRRLWRTPPFTCPHQ